MTPIVVFVIVIQSTFFIFSFSANTLYDFHSETADPSIFIHW